VATAAFSSRLQYRMGQIERTSGWLSRRAGVSKSTASNWVHGRTMPPAERVVQLAGLLHVPVGWLLGEGPLDLPMPEPF
jgi:helix-turn-helix protein